MELKPFMDMYGGPIATLVSVFISGTIAIFLFLRSVNKERKLQREQLALNQLEESRKRLAYLTEVKNYFVSALSGAIEDSLKQADLYEEFINELISHPGEPIQPKRIRHVFLDYLTDFNPQGVFEVFWIKGKADDAYLKLYKDIGYLKQVFIDAYNDLNTGNGKTLLDLMQAYLNLRRILLDKAARFNEWVVAKNQEEFQETYDFLNELIYNYHKGSGEGVSFEYDTNHLYEPILNRIENKKFRYSLIGHELLFLTKDCKDFIQSIYDMQDGFVETFDKAVPDIRLVCGRLTKQLENLKTTELSEADLKFNS